MEATHAASERSSCASDWSEPSPRVDDSDETCSSRLGGRDGGGGGGGDGSGDCVDAAAVPTGVICSTCARWFRGARLMAVGSDRMVEWLPR